MPAEPDPIEVAAKALRYRDRSRAEIAARLARAGIGEDQQAEALETLERVGYVDDGRYGAARAAELAARDLGDEAIRFDLHERGVAPEQVEAALAALAPEAERAIAVAVRLGRTAKTAALLGRKGFGEDAIEAAVGSEIAAGGAGGV